MNNDIYQYKNFNFEKKHFSELIKKGERYLSPVGDKKVSRFIPFIGFSDNDVKRVFEFAYNMVFTSYGYVYQKRQGGKKERKNDELFINTFTGKLGEIAVCNYLKLDLNEYIDWNICPKGYIDSGDIKINNYIFSIKSIKYYSNLLLLEKEGAEIKAITDPNCSKAIDFDFIVLVRYRGLLKNNRNISGIELVENYIKLNCLEHNDLVRDSFKRELYERVEQSFWEGQIIGYVTKEDVRQLMCHEIPQGSIFGGMSEGMDADNYYCIASEMRDYKRLPELIDKIKRC